MTPFTMKILGYNAGTYTVEYIPEPPCKPIKLNIQLDQDTLNDKNLVLEKLKQASPQEFWYNQILAAESQVSSTVASSLLNTQHSVRDEIPASTYRPVTSYDFHPRPFPVHIPVSQPSPRVNLAQLTATAEARAAVVGNSTPEQVAPRDEQNIVKLKMLIQQVIQEMADGTV